MKGTHRLINGSALGAISLLTLATGCGDLDEVETFGQSAAIVKTTAALVSNDVYASCLRVARQYRRPTTGSTRFPSARSFAVIEQAEDACNGKEEDAAIIANANATLTNYMEGLGKLASNDTVQFDQNLNALEASIQGLTGLLPGVPGQERDAGLNIARFIFNQFVLGFRRENIKEAILCADDSISEYTEGLMFIAQEYYINGTLRNERLAMDNYYQTLSPSTSAQPSQASERIATFMLRTQYGEELVAFADREAAAQAYIQILDKTVKTHNDLRKVFADGKNMNDQELEEFCAPIFTDMDSSVATGTEAVNPTLDDSEAIAPALDSLDLTPAESEAIAQILRDYHQQVELLALDVTQGFGDN